MEVEMEEQQVILTLDNNATSVIVPNVETPSAGECFT